MNPKRYSPNRTIGDGPPFHLFRSYPIRQTALGLHLILRLKMHQITARSLDYQRFEPGIFFGRTCQRKDPSARTGLSFGSSHVEGFEGSGSE